MGMLQIGICGMKAKRSLRGPRCRQRCLVWVHHRRRRHPLHLTLCLLPPWPWEVARVLGTVEPHLHGAIQILPWTTHIMMLRKTSRTREDTHKKAVHGVPTLQLTVSSRAPRHVIALHAGIGGLAMEVAQHNRFRNLSEQVLSGRHRYRHQMRHTSVTRHTWVP